MPALIAIALLLGSPGPTGNGSFPEHWAFGELARGAAPRVDAESWAATVLDRFVLARLEEKRLRPAAAADRRTLLRRAYLDVTGLPPRPDEINAFLADDSPDALDKVVDRLLASPRHGERWARHWLDVVRYAETAGHVTDRERPNTWRYRDYVIDALNGDLPYDRFIVEHVAGDLLEKPRPGPRGEPDVSPVATGFLWFHEMHFRPVDPIAQRADQVDAQIDIIGKAFLGLTTACARCHDHKFDPIPQRDYYAIAGILHSARRVHTPLNAQTEATAKRDDAVEQRRARIREAVAAAARKVRDRRSKKTDEPLIVDEDSFDVGDRASLARLRAELARLAPATTMWAPTATSTAGHDVRIQIGGDHRRPGDVVPRGFLSAVGRREPPALGERSGRRWLAEQIADARNPLTARVVVNRLWQHHFGAGIVRSPNNFGRLGERPTHPLLLDHLAHDLIESGWSLKTLHRKILLSSPSRRGGAPRPGARRIDPQNRLLHHMPPRRLEAEAIRDSILAAAGSLDLRMDGGSLAPYISPNASSNKPSNIPESGPLDGDGRRSVYLKVRRNFATPFLATFDLPDPSSSVPVRTVTVGPAQSLAMLNSPFVHEQARRWGKAIADTRRDAGPESVIDEMLETAIGRHATERERRALVGLLGGESEATTAQSYADVAHLIFNMSELIFLR